MWLFWNTFYDKYWNFNNEKFIELLEKAKKAKAKKWANKGSFANKEISLFNSVSKKEVWQFINKFSIFLSSWIDVKWALNILVKQIKNPYLKKIVNEIKINIDHWIAINETMSSYPKVFDTLTIALIKVWEKTWKLAHILQELDKSMLESIELKAKVKWAMIYPMILLGLTILMVTFMMIFIVPRVTESFEKAWAELPKPTQVVVSISHFLWWWTYKWENVIYHSDWTCEFRKINVRREWPKVIKTEWDVLYFWKEEKPKKWCHVSSQSYKILLAILFIIILYKLLNKTYYWRLFFSKVAINLPIFGYIVKQSNIVYFIKSFTLLLNSWVLLLESLKTSSQVVSNLAYKKELIRIKNEVEVWLTISKSLWLNLEYDASVYLNKLFSEEFAYVVSTWEETWTLAESLQKIGENYNKELKRYIWNLSSMMEPIIIVIVWALVGTIIIAILMPFFEMWKVAKNL